MEDHRGSIRISTTVFVCLSFGSVALADLEPGHVVQIAKDKQKREAARMASDAAQALIHGDFPGALSLSERALEASASDPWAHYVRAEALVRLGRIDDAVPEHRMAEKNLPSEERWSRSIVLWARANAFHQAGRCPEANAAFGEYIAFVKKDDPRAAEAAQALIDGCRPLWVNPAAKAPTPK
jgi:hypothetical protein